MAQLSLFQDYLKAISRKGGKVSEEAYRQGREGF